MKPAPAQSDPEPARPAAGKGLAAATGTVGAMTLLSRALGLVRDIVIARVFGASDAADAFFLANKIPNFMRRLFAEGAFSQAFVPVLSEYRARRSPEEVRGLLGAAAGSLGAFLLALTAAVVAAAPFLAVPIAWGFTDEPAKFQLFVDMLRVTFPYLFLISMTALCGAVLNSHDRFAVPAFTPVLLNVSLIACALALAPRLREPAMALAWGVLIAGVVQLGFQLPFLARLRLLPRPVVGGFHEGVARIKKLMAPALFGVSVSQINLLLDTFIASLLASGSVSWLYFSDRLMELPLGAIGIAIGIAVLPSLSRQHARNSMAAFTATLDWAFRVTCLAAVPATLGLMLLAEPLLVTLFYNSNFTETDVANTAASLRAYAAGLPAFMAIKVFAPGYYARQNTATPVRVGAMAMGANMVLNVAFYLNGLAHVGLALATSLAAALNAGLLLAGLRRDGVFRFQAGWLQYGARLLAANLAMAGMLAAFRGDWRAWLDWTEAERALGLAALVLGAVALYAAALAVAGLRWRDVHR